MKQKTNNNDQYSTIINLNIMKEITFNPIDISALFSNTIIISIITIIKDNTNTQDTHNNYNNYNNIHNYYKELIK